MIPGKLFYYEICLSFELKLNFCGSFVVLSMNATVINRCWERLILFSTHSFRALENFTHEWSEKQNGLHSHDSRSILFVKEDELISGRNGRLNRRTSLS